MSLIFNGTTIASNYTVSFNGTNLTSIVYNGTPVWTSGTYSLVASVFNSSGTFTVPNGVTSIVVACTGGGGAANMCQASCSCESGGSGGGSGRTSGTFTVTPGSTYSVTVGSGVGAQFIGDYAAYSSSGGTSSFGSLLSCGGGGGAGTFCGTHYASGTSGGGTGYCGDGSGDPTSNCPAVLTLSGGAVDTTGGLYSAKSYGNGASGNIPRSAGGSGCYGYGGYIYWPNRFSNSGSYVVQPTANSGGGGGTDYFLGTSSASGKVVIFYYAYV